MQDNAMFNIVKTIPCKDFNFFSSVVFRVIPKFNDDSSEKLNFKAICFMAYSYYISTK